MITLDDISRLYEQYVPKASRWPSTPELWWPAHELGHLLTTERWRHGKPLFALYDKRTSKHEMRCRELAAMSVSRRLLRRAGETRLIRDEIETTDGDTLYYDDRGRVREILVRFGVLRLPVDLDELEAVIVRNTTLTRHAETHAIREALVASANLRRSAGAIELFARVTDEWGEIGERRLWRALEWCVEHGRLTRVGAKFDASKSDTGERRSGYLRAAT